MYFLYRGLLHSHQAFGLLDRNNFQIYVLLGTTCHSLLMACVYTFRSKMVMEKWWQTVTATLISPLSTLELLAGYLIGSGSLNFLISALIFSGVSLLFPVTASTFFLSILILFLIALWGFGIGMIGATLVLCWEGKSFLFDYGIQAIIFLSCFYYPIETLPNWFHSVIHLLPTFHASQIIQELFLVGKSTHLMESLAYVTASAVFAVVIPALFFNYSVKKYGIVGY